jgi:S1-C subfamily serine protease
MKRLMFTLPILAGAIAGAIVALAISSGNSSKTVTETVVSASSASTGSTSSSSSSGSTGNTGATVPASSSTTGGSGLSVNEIYKADAPGVVDITVASLTSGSSSGNSGGGLLGGGSGEQEQEDEGAGVVYDTKGDIITDEHVVAGTDAKVEVHFQNGVNAKATIVGEDASTDVAVIHVDQPASELHPIEFADSSTAQVGDPVVAIGSPFSLPETVTQGIVSAVGRTIDAPNGYAISSAIQTDAAINPGNSGGPLLDASGEVLGLNDQIETNSDDSDGVGFATPGDTDVQVIKEMISGKKVQHAYVGVCIQDPLTGSGAEIVPDSELANSESSNCQNESTSVVPGSPAAKAGLKQGDVITAVNGTTITSEDQFVQVLSKYAPGDTVTFTVKVPGSSGTKQFKVTLANRPATSSSSSSSGG